MKTFIASDFHGMNPSGLVRELQKEGIERAVFLGDYDEPEILRDILNLDIDKVVLMGNHDYEFCRGGEVYSKDLVRPLEEYWNIWGDTAEGEFARECPLKIVEEDVVYLHGSIADSFCDGEQEVWGRVLSDDLGFTRERRTICNFRKMKKIGYNVMFRGHDHFPITFSTNRDDYIERIKQVNYSIDNTILGKDDMYIVNLGAFLEGEYALFDSESLRLEYMNVLDRKI